VYRFRFGTAVTIDTIPLNRLDLTTYLPIRTAYFNGDHVTAAKKGVNLPNRSDQVSMMAQMQNMTDFPPTSKLEVGRFYNPETVRDHRDVAAGPIKTFTLRGIKDSPPYLHDGRLLTSDDTVAFFNVVLSLHLDKEESDAPVAFLRCL